MILNKISDVYNKREINKKEMIKTPPKNDAFSPPKEISFKK